MELKTLADVKAWFDRVNAVLTTLHEAESRVAECMVRIEQANELQVKRLTLRWQSELEFAEAQRDVAMQQLFGLTRKHDREEASNVLVAAQVRMEAAIDLKEEWQRALADRERVVYANVLQERNDPNAPDVQGAEQAVSLSESTYRRSLLLLVAAIPTSEDA